MFDAASLLLGYDQHEDRLWIMLVSEDQTVFKGWLTRRRLERLISPLAVIIEHSNPYVRRLPPGQSTHATTDILAMEHQAALQGRSEFPWKRPLPRHPRGKLISKVEFENPDKRLRLLFCVGDTPEAALTIGRPELHRLLAKMVKLASKADWHLQDVPYWIGSWPGTHADAAAEDARLVM